METVYRFRRDVQVEFVEPDAVFFLAENHRRLKRGDLVFRLAQAIDGARSQDEISDLLIQHATLPEIYYCLDELIEHELIEEVSPAQNLQSLANERVQPIVVKVAVEGEGAADVRAALGAASACSDSPVDLVVYLVDDYLDDELAAINRQMIERGQRWMLAKTVGATAWMGPVFHPSQTPCWKCMVQRMKGHRPIDGFLETLGRRMIRPTPPSSGPAHAALLLMVADQAVRAARDKHHLAGELITLEIDTLESRRHAVARLAECTDCGDPEHFRRRGPLPLVLENRPLLGETGGGYRTASPESTLERIARQISPITGVVGDARKMASVEKIDLALPPSFAMSHLFVRKFDSVDKLIHTMHNVSGGKGRTETDAKISGFCEAIERYSGLYNMDAIIERGSYFALKEMAVCPRLLMQFSERQYAERSNWNARYSHHQFVPVRYEDDVEIAWTPVWSMRDRQHRLLPAAYLYYGYATIDCRSIYADSNGCAAGNSLEEAILQGFLELCERDAAAIWWYNCLRRPGVDLASFKDPFIDSLVFHYQQLGREVWALDLTNDLGVTVFAAVSRRIGAGSEDIIFGFGAHFDASLALSRAMTELHQCLPCVSNSTAAGAGQYRFPSRDATVWWREADLKQHPYLIPDPAQGARTKDAYPRRNDTDIRDVVEHCVAITSAKGLDFLVHDQTRPDVGFPVVKVIVPGLRHFWARYAPGRLYERPVAAGERDAPTPEAELNPYPIFL